MKSSNVHYSIHTLLPFLAILVIFHLPQGGTAVSCTPGTSCSCDDPLLNGNIQSCTNDGFCSGEWQTTGCKSSGGPTECPFGWPVNEDVSGGCTWGWHENFKCGQCAPGHEDKRGLLCLDCTQWGIPVYSTCEVEQRCAPCEPGEYAASAGSSTCQECPAGKQSYGEFISKTEMSERFEAASSLERMTMFGGSSSCQSCIPGRYGEETGELLCDSCKGNKYSETGWTECQYCEPGYYANNFNPTGDTMEQEGEDVSPVDFMFSSTGCEPCPAGKFSRPSTNALGCVPCNTHPDFGPGYSSDGGDYICYPCPVGKYTSDGICTPCEPGKYADEEGSSFCKLCNIFGNDPAFHGSWISNSSSADCVGCVAGRYMQNNTCVACDAGKYSTFSDTVCTSCLVRYPLESYTSTAGQSSCSPCPAGKFMNSTQDPDDVVCRDCRPGYGYYQTDGAPRSHSAGCLPCPYGRISSGGGGGCEYCPAGKYETGLTTNICVDCPAAKYMGRGDQISDSCFPCAPGKTATGGNEVCTNCPANTYEGTYDGASWSSDNTCHACPDPVSGGPVASEGSFICTHCALGKAEVNGACVTCPPGKHATSSEGCKSCEAGRHAPNSGMQFCIYCTAGRYSGVGAEQCNDCPDGQVNERPTGNPCEQCEAGKSPDSNHILCVTCSGGKFNPTAGAAGCINCDAGKYAPPDESLTECKSCTAGTYSSAQAYVCVPCGLGSYAPNDNAQGCEDCPQGKTSELNLGSSTCQDCPAGRSATAGSFVCTECLPGKYADSQGSPGCTNCETGKAIGDLGAITCQNCAPGRYADETGKTSCDSCIRGKVSNSEKTSCDACPLGKYTSSNGEPACLLCEAGKTSEASDVTSTYTSCETCPMGQTSVTGGSCTNCPANSLWSAGFCYAANSDFSTCPPSNKEGKHNECHYYYSGSWQTVLSTAALPFSPFSVSCASYGTCHTDTSAEDHDEYHIYCSSCEAGYLKYTFPANQGDCSAGGLTSSTPGICYRQASLGTCPNLPGVSCNYIYNGAVVSKGAGELSPFGNSCSSFKICSVVNNVWTIFCESCDSTNDYFGGTFVNSGTQCGGTTYPSRCFNVPNWETCPAEAGGGRKLGGQMAYDQSSDLFYEVEIDAEDGDSDEDTFAGSRKLPSIFCNSLNCPSVFQECQADTFCNANSCCDDGSGGDGGDGDGDGDGDGGGDGGDPPAAMNCQYLSQGSNNYVTVAPSGNAPVQHCGDYTACSITSASFFLQCNSCEDGYLEGRPASVTKGTCSTSDPNPSTCYEVSENTAVDEDFEMCPDGIFQDIQCDYKYLYGTETVFADDTDKENPLRGTCVSWKVCGVTHEGDVDRYDLRCAGCAGGFIPDQGFIFVINDGSCGDTSVYYSKCGAIPTDAPSNVPSAAPSTFFPSAERTNRPTILKLNKNKKEDPNFFKDNIGMTVGGGFVCVCFLFYIGLKLCHCGGKEGEIDSDDDDFELSTLKRKAKKEKKRGSKRSKSPKSRDRASSEFEGQNPMSKHRGNSKERKTKSKKSKKEKHKHKYEVSVDEEVALHRHPPPPNDSNSDWVPKLDKNSGKTFYYNKVTKEVTWKLPKGAPNTAPPPAPTKKVSQWAKHTDSATGNDYYFNSTTGETSWEYRE